MLIEIEGDPMYIPLFGMTSDLLMFAYAMILPASLALFILGWFFTSLSEREFNAAFRFAVLLIIPLILALLMILLKNHCGLILILNLILVIGLIMLTIPLKSPSRLRIDPEAQHRIDERDALFHRFYRLKPGSPSYQTYYRSHPDQKITDEKIKSLPELNATETPGFDPILSPFADAMFNSVSKINRYLDTEHVNTEKLNISPYRAASGLKSLARELGADLVGITKLNPCTIYSHIGRGEGIWGTPIRLPHTHAIAIAVEMQYRMIRKAPGAAVIAESGRTYYETAKIARVLAYTIQRMGYSARAHVDGNYRVMVIPVAVDAGLGELGRHGLIITHRFGPRVRLSVVTTNLPMDTDDPIRFGVQNYCALCKKCAIRCPSQSISDRSKIRIAGVEKWQSRQTSCYHYWRKQGTDCALCIRVCPYSNPDTPLHRMIRHAIRKNPVTRILAVHAESFIYPSRT
jgi:ferredoxin